MAYPRPPSALWLTPVHRVVPPDVPLLPVRTRIQPQKVVKPRALGEAAARSPRFGVEPARAAGPEVRGLPSSGAAARRRSNHVTNNLLKNINNHYLYSQPLKESTFTSSDPIRPELTCRTFLCRLLKEVQDSAGYAQALATRFALDTTGRWQELAGRGSGAHTDIHTYRRQAGGRRSGRQAGEGRGREGCTERPTPPPSPSPPRERRGVWSLFRAGTDKRELDGWWLSLKGFGKTYTRLLRTIKGC